MMYVHTYIQVDAAHVLVVGVHYSDWLHGRMCLPTHELFEAKACNNPYGEVPHAFCVCILVPVAGKELEFYLKKLQKKKSGGKS